MNTLTVEQVLRTAAGILRAAEYAFLVTLGATREIHARLMQHFKPEDDLTLWFGASRGSRKVREVMFAPRVVVACHDPGRSGYAALTGVIEVVEDAELRRRYWRDDWAAFWPAGPLGSDYVLLKFTCERVEVMHLEEGVAPEPRGLRPAVAVRRGEAWHLEE
ncbi:MAG: pyridoxamine 5'-phosphate oxidase family protein [Armatimonadota bacterium]|nr:pyridoxamine 5'-phosphate oxidase family protein [Armatimonadota bacterium]MDR7450871.1 pyridoxamine 5'-phosphate oxidase family protein [Armatimonadota bacterium]MDR7465793.1 pyridoxamine 5'-phosphate oxidase family protein [Armatimonadota bacterium]MDR7493701.1 pyridoxamine 5'-phosphate oxidase family protein [Armatimonadota bacterium]MDR7499051.1 pyridoxamine 5'-phosphate oxidase family protein [Armatimonadota bacterium]